MSAAAPQIAQGTPDLRRLGAAVAALTLAVALIVGFAISQQATRVAPAPSHARELLINLPTGGGLRYTGIPYLPRAEAAAPAVKAPVPYQARSRSGGRVIDHDVDVSKGGGYTGIPYTPTPRASTGIPGTTNVAR